MRKLLITLDKTEYHVLAELAKHHEREPYQQARYLLRQSLVKATQGQLLTARRNEEAAHAH